MILVVLIVASSIGAVIVLVDKKIIPTSGIIIDVTPPPPPATIGIDIYSDQTCQTTVSHIDWGELEPGSIGTATLYLKNPGNTPGTLTLTAENWTPPETSLFTSLTWDAEGATLKAGQVMQVHLQLAVNGTINGIGTFGFNIVFHIAG